jgi:hypothetical protein
LSNLLLSTNIWKIRPIHWIIVLQLTATLFSLPFLWRNQSVTANKQSRRNWSSGAKSNRSRAPWKRSSGPTPRYIPALDLLPSVMVRVQSSHLTYCTHCWYARWQFCACIEHRSWTLSISVHFYSEIIKAVKISKCSQ